MFVSRVPALPGCAAHGDSPERAAKEARIAATGILEVMAEHGDPIPRPDTSVDYSGKLGLRLPKSMHEQVARLAAADEVSINTKLLTLIAYGLGQRAEQSRNHFINPITGEELKSRGKKRKVG